MTSLSPLFFSRDVFISPSLMKDRFLNRWSFLSSLWCYHFTVVTILAAILKCFSLCLVFRSFSLMCLGMYFLYWFGLVFMIVLPFKERFLSPVCKILNHVLYSLSSPLGTPVTPMSDILTVYPCHSLAIHIPLSFWLSLHSVQALPYTISRSESSHQVLTHPLVSQFWFWYSSVSWFSFLLWN